MTTHAAMAVPRQPFSALNSPRLQHLQNSKNRQNGILSSSLSDSKPSLSSAAPFKTMSMNPPTKRRLSPSESEVYDSENIDPSSFASPSGNKRSKISCGASLSKTSSFSLITKPTPTLSFTAASSMDAPSAISARLIRTPNLSSRKSSTGLKRANMSSPRAPLTAPAGRSPIRTRHVGDVRSRRVSAPFTRVEPPSFSLTSSSGSSAALPFSLDAALAGTVSSTPSSTMPKSSSIPSSQHSITPVVQSTSAGKLIRESMPSDWFFDIYEDSPDEEAANLMEHSTLTLDLSSDDDINGKLTELADKGKENVAPEDYFLPSLAPSTPSPSRQTKQILTRRKVVKADEMDDGERSPLSDLETEDFFATGLSKDSCIVITASPEKTASATATVAENEEEPTSPLLTIANKEAEAEDKVDDSNASIVDTGLDTEVEILIWEDDAVAIVPTA